MWSGIPQPQMPPQQPYQQGGIPPPVPGIQNRPRLEPIDWNLVAVLNADIIRKTKDYDSLQKLVQMFMGAKLFQGSSRILLHPLCLRLCQLLQVAFEYLNFCQTELSTTNTKLETENAKLTEKTTKLESKLKHSEQIIKLKSIPYDRCPVCKKKFKSLDYVDRHIQNRHSELVDSWNVIRGRELPKKKEKEEDNVQKILDKIDNLKDSLRRGSKKNYNKSIEQELLATQQELMNEEELREQQEMRQNEEIRRQLFAAADDLNSSMTLYKENTQKKKVKKSKQQMAIINLFDQNAEVNPNDYKNSEPSPFNKNPEEEAAKKQQRINDFFSQPQNPFQKHQFRPSTEIEDGPNWEAQMNSRNNVFNPFQNKTNQVQLSIPPDNLNNELNQNQVNNYNNIKFNDEFGFDEINNNNNMEANKYEPIMNTGFKNNFELENMNQNDVQVIPQTKPNSNEDNINFNNINNIIKPIPKQAILAAKKFISRQKGDKNNHSRSVNATPGNIEKMISVIGERVHAEVQRLGPNGAPSVVLRQEYGDNDPNYLQLRKQIKQKLEMEYPMNGEVTKVNKGFDLVHTDDLKSINNENKNQVRNENKSNNYIEIDDNISDQFYSSPSKEKLINKNNLSNYGDSQFTSAFEFQSNKNKQPQNEEQKENEEKSKKDESPGKNKVEISDPNSAAIQMELPKSQISENTQVNDNKKQNDDEWSYITSSVSEKVETKEEQKDKNKNKTKEKSKNSSSIIKDVNPHSISFDSTSTSSKFKTKANKDNQNKTEFDFIQDDMKPTFSDSPSRKTETQAISPVQNPKISASIIKGNSNKSNKNDNKNNSKSAINVKNDLLISASSEKDPYRTPERKKPDKSDAISLEIFKSPVLSNSSNSNLSAKSKSKTNSNRKILLDDDEDVVENLSDIDKMFQKSKNLSENSGMDANQNLNGSSNKIEPLSEDEFNFPPVSNDSFSFDSLDDNDNKQITKEDLDKKNQLSNRRENAKSRISDSKLNYQSPSRSNINSNLADSESHQLNASSTSKSKQSRMSVLSSAIRIGRADDTKAVFQSSSINETNSPSASEKEPVISRRKNRNSPIKNTNKKVSTNKSNIVIDDIDPKEEEEKKKKKFEEYKKIADEKFRKEFDFEIDNISNDGQELINKKDDEVLDEFELTGKSNKDDIKIIEEEEIDDSEDESGFANPPPRIEFHLKALDEDNDVPVKNSNVNNRPGIRIIHKTDTNFGQHSKSFNEDNNNDNKSKSNNNKKSNNSSLFQDVKKTILKQTGITMVNRTNTKYGQPRSDNDSKIDDDDDDKKQFNEENDRRNQILSNSFLKNSRNFNLSKNLNVDNNDYSDDENKYGYVSDDDDEINGLPHPDYFDDINKDQATQKKNLIPKRKQYDENSLFTSPLPPDPSESSDPVYQPENERLTFYEKKTKPSKTKVSSSSKRKANGEKKDVFEFTNAEPSLMNGNVHSDDF